MNLVNLQKLSDYTMKINTMCLLIEFISALVCESYVNMQISGKAHRMRIVRFWNIE